MKKCYFGRFSNRTGGGFPKFLVIVFLIILGWTINVSQANKLFLNDTHPDEPIWTAYSYLTFYLFAVERNIYHNFWLIAFPHTGMTPSTGKLIIGAYLYAKGINAWNPKIFFFRNDRTMEWNKAQGFLPDFESVRSGRKLIALFGVGVCFLVGLIISRISVLAAWIAPVLLFFHPLFSYMSVHVLMDMIAQFFSCLSFWAFLRADESCVGGSSNKKTFLFSILSGVALGMAVGTKMRELLTAFCFFSVVLFYVIKKLFAFKSKQEIGHPDAVIFLLIGLSSTIFFILTNPGFYSDPLKTFALFLILGDFQSDEMRTVFWPKFALWTFSDKARAIFEVPFKDFGFFNNSFLIEIPLVVAGIYFLLSKCFFKTTTQARASIPIGIFLFIAFLGNCLWIPLRFERYFLPFVFCFLILEALAIGNVINFFLTFKTPDG